VSQPSPNWRIALLVLGVSITGCSKLFKQDSPVAPSGPPAAGSNIVYSAVGASDAMGVGSSVVCLPFSDCPDGMGYVPVTVRALKARAFTVKLLNLGIPTAVIGRDFEALGLQYGRTILGNFIDGEMPFVQIDSTLTTIFTGVNDAITVVGALGGGAGAGNQQAYIDTQVKAFATDYSTLVAGIRTRASSTRIIALNVPNVGALPYFAGAALDQRQAQQRLSVGFTTTAVNVLVSQGVTVVDLMCDPRSYMPSNYSGDFHPNDAGYAFISSEIVNAITSSSYPAPRSSCPQMTTVP
jgi:lysophospholipase L1-like esterase